MRRDPNRETIRLVKWARVPNWYRVGYAGGDLRGLTAADSFQRAIRNMPIKERYLDRLQRKDMQKVALLNMAEPLTYVEGVGIYRLRTEWGKGPENEFMIYPMREYLIHA